ncbi:hypothetical protein OYT88_11795 [Sporolactobacillus sp. CQH2019]|uniref:hypothetical protein n=1 Tax=Sporolactobacillus sp. CQH2019 TaxID=3023512 RepID=UPI002367D41E|nr:hypothetical protein [Sporolactobacillus sp. CQH2019]MDD9149236.1 hypothetical protein [Sporolactobacillus sp. CQH2019]
MNLVENIVRVYAYIKLDEPYVNIWRQTTKKADYDQTMQRFYDYISDPKNKHAAPIPADIVINGQPKDGFDLEREKMQRWEEEAREDPPDWDRARELFKRLEVDGDA